MNIENVLIKDHFDGVDHSATFSVLKTLLKCKSLEEVSAVTLDCASTMEFGKRDEDSMIKDSKFMSLNQRWFTKKESRFERRNRDRD